MPTVEQITAAGPWAVLVFVLIAGFAAFGTAIWKRQLVPGWIYDRLEQRADAAEAEVKRLSRSVARLTLALSRERRRRRTDTRDG